MNILQKINAILLSSGINVKAPLNFLRGIPVYIKNYSDFSRQARASKNEFPIENLYPCPADRFEEAGVARGAYFHQDILVARRIFLNNPEKHVDIGSRVDGFVAHVASFRTIEVFDIRNIANTLPSIIFKQADLTSADFNYFDYCDSVSSLHAIEHFGLGRYGDKLDYYGYIKGLDNIYKILVRGGKFYFSVPIGKQRIEYDAHHVFSLSYILEMFKDKYRLDSFSYVDDSGNLHADINLDKNSINNNCNCTYGCGIFELTKM